MRIVSFVDCVDTRRRSRVRVCVCRLMIFLASRRYCVFNSCWFNTDAAATSNYTQDETFFLPPSRQLRIRIDLFFVFISINIFDVDCFFAVRQLALSLTTFVFVFRAKFRKTWAAEKSVCFFLLFLLKRSGDGWDMIDVSSVCDGRTHSTVSSSTSVPTERFSSCLGPDDDLPRDGIDEKLLQRIHIL